MMKERARWSNRKYANIIIAYTSKLIYLEYRNKIIEIRSFDLCV